MLRRRKAPEHFIVVEAPYVKLLLHYILSLQLDDGSWFHDPLSTASVVRLLCSHFLSTHLNVKKAVTKASGFLEEAFKKLIDSILAAQDLYANLDTIILMFGEISLALKALNLLNRFKAGAVLALKKLEKNLLKFLHAFGDVEVIAHFVDCYINCYFETPSREIVYFLFDICVARNIEEDAIIAVNSLVSLHKRYPDFIKKIWSEYSRRLHIKSKPFSEWIVDAFLNKISGRIDDLDIRTLKHAAAVASKLKERTIVEKISERVIKELKFIWNLLFTENSKKITINKPFYIALSLLETLTCTSLTKSVVLSSHKIDYIIEAVKWYREKQRDNIVFYSKLKDKIFCYLIICETITIFCLIAYILTRDITCIILNIMFDIIIPIIIETIRRWSKEP